MIKRVRNIRIYQRYFEMIKNGSKTIEIRVGYPSMRSIKPGTILRFNDDPSCERMVKRVSEYKTFEEMLKSEQYTKINPNASAEAQLAELKKIFPSDKEKMGVLVFELEVIH